MTKIEKTSGIIKTKFYDDFVESIHAGHQSCAETMCTDAGGAVWDEASDIIDNPEKYSEMYYDFMEVKEYVWIKDKWTPKGGAHER